ncbi:hypothetical protein H2203_008895 [Taxawa tesnikishii (nom. ined.)]|nr:hypothetical protein H2203_008895 [Dothideales sp. JES 119]
MLPCIEPLKTEAPTLFTLPAEIRIAIYELIWDAEDISATAFRDTECPDDTPHELCDGYYASSHLEPLLTCRQFHSDANLFAFSRTTFVIRNPYTALEVTSRLTSRLRPEQISAIRHIAFVADSQHFRQMRKWKEHAFGLPSLQLDELSIVLHRSSYMHYLQDFNTLLVALLRDFQGAKRITYIRNHAKVKPTFHAWYNRFVSVLLKTDHHERFVSSQPRSENTWWDWDFDAKAQTVRLQALPAKSEMDIEEYQGIVKPLLEAWKRSLANEEYDPDPMSRNGFV